MASARVIRIFLSSPGDVADERAIVLHVIDRLAYDPLLRGKVAFNVIAWDKPGADTPMLATMTPQEAINQGLAKPSDCDIVIVILWARMGTPLPHPDYQKEDGSAYQSGTEWEYEDARQAALKRGKPYVVVYRRIEEPIIGLRDPQRSQKINQWERVEAFFAQFTDETTGAIRGGINQYEQPDGLREKVETHLKALIQRLWEESDESVPTPAKTDVPLWKGSPFPGLRAFTPEDAPIFFGRGAETDALIKRLSDSQTRFITVVGASGSGKSSLVGAGLLPRLSDNAIEGSRDWAWVRFTPGAVRSGDPFEALSVMLREKFPLSERLTQTIPEGFNQIVDAILPEHQTWAELVLFIDQFEELFSLVQPRFVEPFIDFLVKTDQMSRVRVVATLRADFLPTTIQYPELARLLNRGSYNLPLPEPGALYEMITRPADRAGLQFEEGLASRILSDTGGDPGALALMAYALDELYRINRDDRTLNFTDYEVLGGVQGAIGERAEHVFKSQTAIDQAALPIIFQELVEVDEHGVAVRRRAALRLVARDESAMRLMKALTAARLLVQSQGEGDDSDDSIVEVAHEALLRSWKRLADWIESRKDDLRLRSQIEQAANEWKDRSRDPAYLLSGGRLADARMWQMRFPAGELEETFIAASVQLEQEQQAREAERQQRELTLQKRAASRLRYIVAVLAVSLVGAIGLTALAVRAQQGAEASQRDLATQVREVQYGAATATHAEGGALIARATSERRANEAEASLLLSNAQRMSNQRAYDRALALAIEAARITLPNPPVPVQRFLGESSYDGGPSRIVDGTLLLGFNEDGTTLRYKNSELNLATGEIVSVEPVPDFDETYSPDRSLQFRQGCSARRREGNSRRWTYFCDKRTYWIAATETQEVIHDLDPGEFTILQVAFSADGKLLIAGGCGRLISREPVDLFGVFGCDPGGLIIWDASTGEEIRRVSLNGSVRHFYMAPGDENVVTEVSSSNENSGSGGHQLVWWNFRTNEEVLKIDYTSTPSVISPDGASIFVHTVDSGWVLHDLESGDMLQMLGTNFEQIEAISPSMNRLLGFRENGMLVVVELGTNEISTNGINEYVDNISRASFSPDGSRLLIARDDGLVLYKMPYPRVMYVIQASLSTIGEIMWHPTRPIVVTLEQDVAKVWDLTPGDVDYDVLLPGRSSNLAVSPDGQTALVSIGSRLLFVNVYSGEILRVFEPPFPIRRINRIRFSPDGSMFAVAGCETVPSRECNELMLFTVDIETEEAVRFTGDDEINIVDMAFSPDGHTLLTVGVRSEFQSRNHTFPCESSVGLWDVASHRLLRCYEAFRYMDYQDGRGTVAFLPDSNFALVGASSYFAKLVLLNVETGEIVREYETRENAFIEVSTNGQSFVVGEGAFDWGQVALFNIKSETPIRQFPFSHYLRYVAFGPDEQTVFVSTESDATIYDIATGEILRQYDGFDLSTGSAAITHDRILSTIGDQDVSFLRSHRLESPAAMLEWAEQNRALPSVFCSTFPLPDCVPIRSQLDLTPVMISELSTATPTVTLTPLPERTNTPVIPTLIPSPTVMATANYVLTTATPFPALRAGNPITGLLHADSAEHVIEVSGLNSDDYELHLDVSGTTTILEESGYMYMSLREDDYWQITDLHTVIPGYELPSGSFQLTLRTRPEPGRGFIKYQLTLIPEETLTPTPLP